jgi:hypothetical protein
MSKETLPLIGPHEGRELELMLAGEKPAAMFHEIIGHDEGLGLIPEKDFQPYVDQGVIVRCKKIYSSGNRHIRQVFYALPDHVNNMDRLMDITDHLYDPQRDRSIPWPEALERETGKLLGYTDEAVEVFLKHIKKNAA